MVLRVRFERTSIDYKTIILPNELTEQKLAPRAGLGPA